MARINYRTDDLRALLALSTTHSFVRAAELLHITQSAFSRRIAQLEMAVGGSLVERSTRRVTLSPLGLDLVREAGPLLSGLDESVEEAGRRARGEAGRIVVACLTTVAYALLPTVLAEFHERYPQVRLQLRDDTGQRVTASVLQHEAEFGISVLGAPAADLHVEHVANDPYVIAFRTGHPLSCMREVEWSPLAQWRPASLRSTSANRQQIDEALMATGIALPWFDEVEHLSSMLGLLRSGISIAVLPRLALDAGGGELQTRPLVQPDIVRRIGLVRRTDAHLSLPAQTLWDMLLNAFRALETTVLDSDKLRSG